MQLVYEWRYLFCVVDGRSGKLLWNWIDSMRSERIAEAVNGLRHGTDVGALVWDGARGHRSRLVDVVGLPTIVQPAYSPELNPAERVFEEVRRWVEGRIYGSIEEKVEAVNAYRLRLTDTVGVSRCASCAARNSVVAVLNTSLSCPRYFVSISSLGVMFSA